MMQNILLTTETTAIGQVDYKLIYTIISAFAGALIGGGITVWYKVTELKNLKENLNLQKQVFDEALKNNELKLKAELVRLEDLNRQYKLSLSKHDLEHLSKVLEVAGDTSEKASMLKEFSIIDADYKNSIPDMTMDLAEYEESVSYHVYGRLSFIKDTINTILRKYPYVFLNIHDEFHSVASEANNLLRYIFEYKEYNEEIDRESIVQHFYNDLLNLHKNFSGLLQKMQEEFKEIELLRRQYIRSQYNLRIQQENDPTTT